MVRDDMMNGAGSASVDWTDQEYNIGPSGGITWVPLRYSARADTPQADAVPGCRCSDCARVRAREANSRAARIGSVICQLDALRAELVAIKASL